MEENATSATARPAAKRARPAPKKTTTRKPAAQAAAKAGKKPIRTAKTAKVKKPKLVRDSFTIPKDEYGALAELKQREAFGRAAEPWEVANVMVMLASDYASYMTGEVVAVSSQQA
mgnify:CR=1 FL=1